jgi:hypothetical protein
MRALQGETGRRQFMQHSLTNSNTRMIRWRAPSTSASQTRPRPRSMTRRGRAARQRRPCAPRHRGGESPTEWPAAGGDCVESGDARTQPLSHCSALLPASHARVAPELGDRKLRTQHRPDVRLQSSEGFGNGRKG